jgi:hypothetical protein
MMMSSNTTTTSNIVEEETMAGKFCIEICKNELKNSFCLYRI